MKRNMEESQRSMEESQRSMEESQRSMEESQRNMEESRRSDLQSPTALRNSDILEEIFMNLPPHLVVCLCRLVCHQWKEVVDRPSFWRERCKREGYQPWDPSKPLEDWRLFYFLCKQRRNLIKNPKGEESLRGWNIEMNGGDGWLVGPLRIAHPDRTVRMDFATSFEMCWKSQLIDVNEEGYPPSFMDTIQPVIKISDWFSRRSDCHSQYNVRVDLLNQNMEVVQHFSPEPVVLPREEWREMTHSFRNYGPGVRYIRFIHGGKDLKWWKGFYGVRLTNTCVEICPAKEA